MNRYTVTAMREDGQEEVLPNPAKMSSKLWTARTVAHQYRRDGLLEALLAQKVGDEYAILYPKRALVIRRVE